MKYDVIQNDAIGGWDVRQRMFGANPPYREMAWGLTFVNATKIAEALNHERDWGPW